MSNSSSESGLLVGCVGRICGDVSLDAPGEKPVMPKPGHGKSIVISQSSMYLPAIVTRNVTNYEQLFRTWRFLRRCMYKSLS